MARRRRRRRREVTFADLTEQSLESLNRIKTLISTADSITTSLRSVLGTYQAMQNDGSLNLLLSGSQTSRGAEETADD
ncbi:MAG TPA: hypothetical protein GXX47_02025 [Firmicutes bacterium]|nr:hypothetical protein [Bacillota bacterium]